MDVKPKPVEVFTSVQLMHHTILLMVTAEKFIRGQSMVFPHNQERQKPPVGYRAQQLNEDYQPDTALACIMFCSSLIGVFL
jgi:hypothetical protein